MSVASRDRSRDAPTVVIKPRTGWIGLDLRELWSFRDLLYFLAWRDVKIRYKQTAFGAAWAILQPVALMGVFTLFLGGVPGLAPEGVPYPVFALSALVPWTFFAAGLAAASASLVNSANLLQKVYFPRLLLPIGAVAAFLLDFGIGLALLAVVVIASGVELSPSVLWILPLAILAAVMALAFGVWLAAVNVRYRDVRYVVPFALQILLLASPIAYPLSAVPEQWRGIYQLNPIVGLVEGFRWAILDGVPPVLAVGTSVLIAMVFLTLGLVYFRRVERTFADVI